MNMSRRKSRFEDLECWQAARQLRRFIYARIYRTLPDEERYRFGNQIVSAARSVTANIAEGYGRFHYLDEAKFLCNARGSAYEVLDHVIAGNDDGFISNPMIDEARLLIDQTIGLINGYRAYLIREHSRTPRGKGG